MLEKHKASGRQTLGIRIISLERIWQSMWKLDWIDIAHLRAGLHHFVKLIEVAHSFHNLALYY